MLNCNWNALEQKWSLSWVMSDLRESIIQIADELKSNDIDIIIIMQLMTQQISVKINWRLATAVSDWKIC